MALTVTTKNYSLIDDCGAIGTWVGETPGVVDDFFKEGSNCLGFTVRGAGNNDTSRTVALDLSGTKHLRLWFMTVALKELNWVQLFVSDGVNTGYYDILASADYPGGWYNIVIDLSRAVDAGTKPDMTVLTTLGLRYNHTGVAKNAQNTWIDHICVNDGLIAYGTPVFDLDDILVEDEDPTNGWGIIRKISGVFYLVGSLTFGDTAADELEVKDISQILIFEDRKVNANLYNLTVVGNAVGATQKFQLGDISGGKGISGCLVKSEGAVKYDVTCTDTDVDDFKLYGCTFLDADIITLPPNAAGREVISCNIEGCGRVVADTCKVQFCNFVSSDADAVLINDDPHYVTDCNFINCVNGVEIDTLGDGNYDFNNLKFSGNTYDVNNTCGSALTVTKVGTSDPSTYTGSTVTFAGSVTLKVTVVDVNNVAIENAQVAIYKTSDDSQLMNEDTLATGIAEESYTGGTPVDCYVRVRKSSTGATKYIASSTTGTIVAQTGFSIKITLQEDTNA